MRLWNESVVRMPEKFNELNRHCFLSGSPAKSGPLDFATKNSFPLFFAGEKALVHMY